MKEPSNYWDKRAIERLKEAEKTSDLYINRIEKIYEQAYKNIDMEIAKVYKNYSKETGLDTQKLRELLTRSETEKEWKQMQKQGLDKYIKNNYKSRISRLERIQAQIYGKAKLIYPKEQLEHTMCYRGIINNSYYRAIYDTQMGTKYDFTFDKIDNNLVNSILSEKWSGKNYSQRIWKNTDILADSISQLIGGALLSGQSIQKTSKQIRDRFNVSKYYAERLVRTETNHFNNEADAMAYEEMGVKEYVFVAVLDSRTSEICQANDNKKYLYKDRKVGFNYPPMHPNCRSTTRGYLGEEAEKELKRRARNPITGKSELIDNIDYREWLEKKIKDHGKEEIDKSYKIVKNKANDKIQHENYKKYFKEMDSIDNFIKIKYNNSESWERYKKNYRVLNQYKLDNGTWSNKKILELDEKAISFKRNELRSSEKRSGNIAIMELDGQTFYAHSGISTEEYKGYKNLDAETKKQLILSQKENKYKASKVNEYRRSDDSEYKLFNYIANTKKTSDTFMVNMLSERCICESCKKVMEEFIKDFPNATVNMVSNKKMKDPWKHRRRN